jgi:hypothetical protein
MLRQHLPLREWEPQMQKDGEKRRRFHSHRREALASAGY